MSALKVPDPPYIVAGAMGGPCVIYLVTPLRNALTLGNMNRSASALELYKNVFSKGLLQSFNGGLPMAKAAVPGFLVLGPAFHMFKDVVGGNSAAAVCLTAFSESMIFYGAETNNAQVAFNSDAAKKKGATQITKLHNPMNPVGGVGLGLHITRNILAMSGLRVFSVPCQHGIAKISPDMSPTSLTIVGDFVANVLVSAASAPLHQLYGWSVTTRVADAANPAKTSEPFVKAATKFLKSQYLTESGQLSSVAGRDMVLRIAYNATIFTVYGFIERTLVGVWPDSLQWPNSK